MEYPHDVWWIETNKNLDDSCAAVNDHTRKPARAPERRRTTADIEASTRHRIERVTKTAVPALSTPGRAKPRLSAQTPYWS
jgi:hypothetical protein